MIDWQGVAYRLARQPAMRHGADPITLVMPLARWPNGSLSRLDDWFFWQRPAEGLRVLGLGAAIRWQSSGEGRFAALAAALAGLYGGPRKMPLLATIGFSFWPQAEDDWPSLQLTVPELTVVERNGRIELRLCCAAERAENALARWRALWEEWFRPVSSPAAEVVERPDFLGAEAFLARGKAALAAIARGEIAKVVLARRRLFTLSAALEPTILLSLLASYNPHCAIYGQSMGGRIFLGASPERLLTVAGDSLAVDALAGSRWESASRSLADAKNQREHDYVVASIREALTPLTKVLTIPAAAEMQLAGISHLHRRITGRLRPGVSSADLLAALHPTPAVGGWPSRPALDWLFRRREKRPAWYSGGIGWLSDGQADIAVALRCGLLSGRQAELYAGAGFVAGSDPEEELAETEAKFAAMQQVLLAARQWQAVA